MRVVSRSRRVRTSFLKRIKKAYQTGQLIPQCVYCGVKFTDMTKLNECTMDHLIPLCRGGRNNKENLVPCCDKCNKLKGHAVWPKVYDSYAEMQEEEMVSYE